MKRKIHITESQLEEIAKQIVSKVDEAIISGDDNLANAPTVDAAARETITGAKKDLGISDSSPITVGFSDDALRKKGISECYTKRQIKEARLNKLVKESFKVIKKKNLK